MSSTERRASPRTIDMGSDAPNKYDSREKNRVLLGRPGGFCYPDSLVSDAVSN